MLGKNGMAVSGVAMNKLPPSAARAEHSAGRKNMLLLIQLRWIAVIGQITTIAIVTLGFGIQLQLPYMLEVLACLIAFNIASHLRWHERSTVSNKELFFALLVDVASLTLQLYFSGGVTNPFAFVYLLQVILSAVLLEAWSTWIIVALTSACLAGLAAHANPLILPHDHSLRFFSLYVQGILICFVLNAVLLTVFITRIRRNFHAGDVELAALRQRAAEEEHIVRMGLLASGAAHELGTPLATVSVILGDWRRMPVVAANADLQQDIAEMEAQLQRCKSIVSGILLSAGEARGESSAQTTIVTFLDDLAAAWRASRPIAIFLYENRIEHDLAVVFDSTLKQTIFNLLDNALEASPQWLRLTASGNEDTLIIEVSDAGPGFLPEILANLGTPYQSTKNRVGGGLGLFLVMNVARTLGGTVTARNREEGGAVVQLSLPLAAIMFEEEERDVG
ncbi:ATP-binding protein [Herminiimonas sp. NPDC097707]|uniref:ATP-binding protein n=1 Tax=Herminiimonas sp. NPDC097707 TaxID=3364007 RepID=UPI00383BCCB6